jgi:hypothetical protein
LQNYFANAEEDYALVTVDLSAPLGHFDHAAYNEMLQHEVRGRELPADEMRRVAERTWHSFLKHGWPTTR